MFNLGGGEILVILLLALIVLGPQRLPEAARKLGAAIGEVRRMATGFQNEIKAALDDAEITTGSTPTTNRARPAARPTLPPEATSTLSPTTTSDEPAPGEITAMSEIQDVEDTQEVQEGAATPPPSDASGRDDAVA